MPAACLHFRLIGEKTGNVARGINIAIVNCKLLNSFTASLKSLWLGIQRYFGFLLIFFHIQFSLDLFIYFLFLFFVFSRATPVAYGRSQARGLIGAVAASLWLRHSNTRSEPGLQPTPQLTATLDHQSTEQGQGSNSTSWFLVGFVNHCATLGTPRFIF